ncbi:MAG: gamma-glutamyl-gamma-aminobutyrate hydrolase family protein [Actinomycetota bacterium]|nr:gamma-glutamyl-gamma-aminobutyrate hydrolase family protein [Actinomycetota bacterium]
MELQEGARELSDLDTTGGGSARVAIAGQWRKDAGKFPLLYARAVQLAGGSPFVLSTFEMPPTEEVLGDVPLVTGVDPYDPSGLEGASGLLLPGGGDIDPEWYGCERHPRTHGVSHRRDRFELTLIEEALERDLPILAICHGMQLLNVHLGGTLDQHLADRPNRLQHDRDMPRSEPVHKLRMNERSPLAQMMGTATADVNSHHHQGLDRIADGLAEIAWAEDGVLEGVYMPGRTWVIGVQWHPEVMAPVDPRQLTIFEHLVAASEAHATRSTHEPAAQLSPAQSA